MSSVLNKICWNRIRGGGGPDQERHEPHSNGDNEVSNFFYISHRPDLSESRPYHAVQCGAGMLHRHLSGLRGFATLSEAVGWSREFESKGGYSLVSKSGLPRWFVEWCGGDSSAVEL